MSVIPSLSSTAISTYSSQLESAGGSTSKASQPTSQTVKSPTGQAGPTDQATFSSLALQLSQTARTAATQFPGRSDMSTSALAMAAVNPALVSSSSGLDFAGVAADARTRMDTRYAQMQASGTPYNANSYEGRDTYSLLGDLDRRSLYAVSSNQDGLFSAAEQTAASDIMGRQLGIAMGLYDSNAAQSFTADPAKSYKAGLDFLDSVSAEEKTSAGWLLQHIKLEDGLASLDKEEKPKTIKTLFEIIAEMHTEQAEDEEQGNPPDGTSTSTATVTSGSASTSTDATSSTKAKISA